MTRCPKCDGLQLITTYRAPKKCPIGTCWAFDSEHLSYDCPACGWGCCGQIKDRIVYRRKDINTTGTPTEYTVEYHEKRPRGLIGRLFRK